MRSLIVVPSYEARKTWADLKNSDLFNADEGANLYIPTTAILPNTCSAVFCQCVSGMSPSPFENLLCRGDSHFVIRNYIAHLDRKWEGVLLKSKRKPCILWSAFFMKDVFWICHLANIFLYSVQFIIPQKTHIPDTSQHFLIAMPLPCEQCSYSAI